MLIDQNQKDIDRKMRKLFALKEAEFKCENCGSRGDHGKYLYLYHINRNVNNLSKNNTAILCKKCADWYKNNFTPGQINLLSKENPAWLIKRGY